MADGIIPRPKEITSMKRLENPHQFIIEKLQQFNKEHGHPPIRDEWDKLKIYPSHGCIRKYFGSWNKAIKAAGFDPAKDSIVSEEEMIFDIQRVNVELGHNPTYPEYQKLGKYNQVQSLGGWRYLVNRAGLLRTSGIAKEDLIVSIRQVSQDLGHTPTLREFKSHSKGYSSGPLYKAYQDYNDLIKDANLEPYRKEYTRGFFIGKMKEFVGLQNRIPTAKEFYKFIETERNGFRIFFPKFSDLLRESNCEIRKSGHNPWTRQEIIKSFVEFFDKFHKPPVQMDLHNVSSLPSVNAVKKEFGSMRKAREFIGIPEPIRIQKRRQVICDDGHIVQSHGEFLVDNFLHGIKIPHQVQVYVCKERYWTCDFLILDDLWIEVDGFRNGRQGKKKKSFDEKLKYYKQNGYNYLILHPHTEGWEQDLLMKLRSVKDL